MPKKAPAEAPETETEDRLIAAVGTCPGEKYDIRVDVRQWGDSAPTLRINRIGAKKDGTPFVGALGSLKSPREVDGLLKLLPEGLAALRKALR